MAVDVKLTDRNGNELLINSSTNTIYETVYLGFDDTDIDNETNFNKIKQDYIDINKLMWGNCSDYDNANGTVLIDLTNLIKTSCKLRFIFSNFKTEFINTIRIEHSIAENDIAAEPLYTNRDSLNIYGLTGNYIELKTNQVADEFYAVEIVIEYFKDVFLKYEVIGHLYGDV